MSVEFHETYWIPKQFRWRQWLLSCPAFRPSWLKIGCFVYFSGFSALHAQSTVKVLTKAKLPRHQITSHSLIHCSRHSKSEEDRGEMKLNELRRKKSEKSGIPSTWWGMSNYILSSVQFSSVPWPSGSSRRHERRFSRDPLPVLPAGGPCEQFWHGQRCPLSDVVRPAVPLPTTASPTPPRCREGWFGRGCRGVWHTRTTHLSDSWQVPEEIFLSYSRLKGENPLKALGTWQRNLNFCVRDASTRASASSAFLADSKWLILFIRTRKK